MKEEVSSGPSLDNQFSRLGLSLRLRNWRTILSVLLGVHLLVGCVLSHSGYVKQGEKWVHITIDEGRGKQVKTLTDGGKGLILLSGKHAKSDERVFFEGDPIDADSESFAVIGSDGYSRDKSRVFLDGVEIYLADPKTFEVLGFPYSRDARRVYCGTVWLSFADSSSFTVRAGKKIKYSWLTRAFVKQYPEFDYLLEGGPRRVIVGFGEARSGAKAIRDFSESDS